ncbi:hypothetical protein ACU686_12470 [Yinghuangia aomiensis]
MANGPTDYRHVLELDVDRGPMAELVATEARWGADGQVVSLGQGAGYTEVCASGRVVYRLDTGLGFVGDPIRLLSALATANAARDGCPPLPSPLQRPDRFRRNLCRGSVPGSLTGSDLVAGTAEAEREGWRLKGAG